MDCDVFLSSSVNAEVVPLFGGAVGSAERPARIALIGTFPPRRCGIATFTKDVHDKLGARPDMDIDVYAIETTPIETTSGADPTSSITGIIGQQNHADYLRIAREINEAAYDALWIQHEFGIFGGPDGEMVCDLVDRVAAPLIVTFHTVLAQPSVRQRGIVEHLIARASRIMVMSRHGRETLIARYRTPADLIEIIPHGAPDRPFGREDAFKERLDLAQRKILMTFGLIGPGKGLEHMIEALPAIVARHPDTIYRIVGATHPNLIAEHGESYRESLQELSRSLGVEAHIAWENRYLDSDELLDQLEACDIYVTPYPNMEQATSGTLSYAVALGKAVVSTPYVHAQELLGDGIGVLVDPCSPQALADAVNGLLDDPARLRALKSAAYAAGRLTIWPEFARAGAALVRRAARPRLRAMPVSATPGLSGVWAMSDSCGMLQHSIGIVPDRRHGYCLDDNARALMLMNVLPGLRAEERMQRSLSYAGFIQHAWNPDAGRFRNFMRFDRGWCEETGSEDSNGRGLWALGHTAAHAPDKALRQWALHWFDETAPMALEMGSPRAVAFAMLGSAALLGREGEHRLAMDILDRGADLLLGLLRAARRPDWTWFEAQLSYDNPRLCEALIVAGQRRDRPSWIAMGLETLRWIAARQTASEGHFRPVGSDSFGKLHTQLPFDQQPLEAVAAVDASRAAYFATGDREWINHALTAYRWYFGANDRGVVLADIATGHCRDGVTPRGANENRGAESILAFQLAYYAMLAMNRSGLPDAGNDDDAEAESRDAAHPSATA